MRKYVILFMLFIIIGAYNTNILYDSPLHHHVVVMDEGETIQTNHAGSLDLIDAEKQKLALVNFNIAIFLAFVVTYVVFHFFASIGMRSRLSNPVFYQSNYVITFPSKKII
ncbi:hypothetical protein [Oceanobacillus chungangensis]|uniref:Uncharacterized protein n=1 Tax=Oceanobacillus chungangensis TaxID=1229152 RepID=A0A3D8PJ14_9BACI|nr:hypothetical protein [Oceanobacillus chungangensis]RDW15467.1 hypothetical protein CWR45_16930 [Oceanobacillus chungangensis]